ncbi:AAA family ATPase [bacterium]|jgi:predicted ATPase|nr:AAA family ATPase [bacterium]
MITNNKKIILTGTPSSGKTSIINCLKKKGYVVIQEAATFIIKKEQRLGNQEPWKNSDFINKIVSLQKRRERKANTLLSHVQFFDRSPICTYALATYLGFSPSTLLCDEINRILENNSYEKEVFFIQNLGFITPTNERRIDFKEALIFEQIHKDTYSKFGFNCTLIKPNSIEQRTTDILNIINPKI